MINKRFRYAFSMVELVFVIVVLGIVASIGSSIIAQAFQTYIVQKATNGSSIKTELAAEQIANRLSYAIPWTLIAKRPAAPYDSISFDDNLPGADEVHTALEWIGVDGDSFEATLTPGWSGYCDDKNSITSSCDTPGSGIAMTQTIIGNLSNNKVDFTTTTFAANKPLIVFKTGYYRDDFISEVEYSPSCIGLVTGGTTDCAIKAYGTTGVAGVSHPTLTFDNANPKKRAEHYALAWSAYAIVPANARVVNGQRVYDLILYYNYQPWEGEKYTDNGISSQILVNNVSLFDFTSYDNSIRFKICVLQPIGTSSTEMVTLCKEKVVMR